MTKIAGSESISQRFGSGSVACFLLFLWKVESLPSCLKGSVSDPYSFFTDPDPDPDPEVEAGDQYGSGYGSGSNPDPIRIQGFNDQKLKKNYS